MSRDEVLTKLAAGDITAEDASKLLDKLNGDGRPMGVSRITRQRKNLERVTVNVERGEKGKQHSFNLEATALLKFIGEVVDGKFNGYVADPKTIPVSKDPELKPLRK